MDKDRNFENRKLDTEITADIQELVVPDIGCVRLRKSLKRLGDAFGIYDKEQDTIHGIPIGEVVRPEGEVKWDIIINLEESFEGIS